MELVLTWLQALISLILLLTLAELILPDGSMRPYVRVILGLVLVVAILRPVVQLGAFDWRLPAVSLPPAPGEAPVARGERLAAALQERARQEAEGQVALQAARLLEARLGVRPEALRVRLSPEGWVQRIEVDLGRQAPGGDDGGEGRSGLSRVEVDVRLGVPPVAPVMVGPVRRGGTREAPLAPTSPSSGVLETGDDRRRQVQAVLAGFYQIPADRVQVEP